MCCHISVLRIPTLIGRASSTLRPQASGQCARSLNVWTLTTIPAQTTLELRFLNKHHVAYHPLDGQPGEVRLQCIVDGLEMGAWVACRIMTARQQATTQGRHNSLSQSEQPTNSRLIAQEWLTLGEMETRESTVY
ncbi:hypothetical protein VTJ04DRAFT_6087 [Mycothermus thermophilus]|uniref:uncharacterized protein n=1 Tax=Humicola insolens TaxID=85995 RepID=UPI003743784B